MLPAEVERLDEAALDAAVGKLGHAVEAYGLSWWVGDTGVQDRVIAVPGLNQRLTDQMRAGVQVQTSDVYQQGAVWAAPRPALHEELVGAVLPDRRSLSSSSGPPAFVLFGAPGSGKTSVLRPLLLSAGARTGRDPALPLLALDADEIRIRFPEYAAGLGSSVVQDETSYVTYGPLRELALGDRLWPGGLCLDVVGDPDHAVEDVRVLADRGYRLHLLLATCPTEQRLARLKRRALTNGRFVSLVYAASVGDRPLVAYETARAEADRMRVLYGWAHVDTSDGPSSLKGRVVNAGGSLSL